MDGDPKKLIRSIPNAASTLFTKPSSDSMFVNILATTIHDKKCGNVKTVCTTFLNLTNFISFKRSARMIGIGNWKIRRPMFMYSVLNTADQNAGSPKTRS